MLSDDLRKQLKEPCPFNEAIKFQLQEQNGLVVKVPHSNPPLRAKREIDKLKQDLDDLTLIAKRLNDEDRHAELFSDDAIVALLDGVLDISEKARRETELLNKEQKIKNEHDAKWRNVNDAFNKGRITEKARELERKEFQDEQRMRLAKVEEDLRRECIPDPRRTQLASKIAGLCIDYCTNQLNITEPDMPTVQLFQDVLSRAKILTDSIAGKVRRFEPESKING
jgi:hypothetical protein